MKEETLKNFFAGISDEQHLVAELNNSIAKSRKQSQYRIEDMTGEFAVTSVHIIKVCNAALKGTLQHEHLTTIGFCLEASDTFEWDSDTEDGKRVADVVFYLSSPEINYELNELNIAKFIEILEHGGTPFE